MNTPTQYFFNTVRIAQEIKVDGMQLHAKSFGTGFIVKVPSEELFGDPKYYLVSNKHVLSDPTSKLVLLFHKRGDDGEPVPGYAWKDEIENYQDRYYAHPTLDLACIDISFIGEPEKKVYFRAVPLSMIADYTEEGLCPGLEVRYIGYPDSRFDEAHNLPIERSGIIASVPTVDYNHTPTFIIDGQVWGGSSGSPVYAVIDGKIRLIGVIAQTMIKQVQGVEQKIGLGIAIKSTAIPLLLGLIGKKLRDRHGTA